MSILHLASIFGIVVMLSGCLGQLTAHKGMSEDDSRECTNLITPVKAQFGLSEARIPAGLRGLIGTVAHEGKFPRDDLYQNDEPPSIGCGAEVHGPLRSL